MTFNQSKYVNEYAKEKYDRIQVLVTKGDKDKIKAAAEKKGYKSTNDYIKALIYADIEKA